ncbi:Candidapepsin-2 [Fusarium oxysporum f. sp. albedinis]|nr:Candidapepsin-2 [Fusarium oxysporum f. sp. albedinis]
MKFIVFGVPEPKYPNSFSFQYCISPHSPSRQRRTPDLLRNVISPPRSRSLWHVPTRGKFRGEQASDFIRVLSGRP